MLLNTLNSENAFTAWIAAGAPALEKQDLGNLSHNGCAPFAFINAKNYFDSFKDDCTIGVKDILSLYKINMYPNPAYNELIANYTGAENKRISLSLFNSLGQELVENFESFSIDEKEISLKTSKLKEGVYFLKLAIGTDVVTRKIVVQH